LPFKVLHGFLVLFRRGFCLECAKISSFSRLRIFLPGIQPILAGFQFPDHEDFSAARGTRSMGYSQRASNPRASIYVRFL
jgi:hypothetical protein